MRKCFLFVALSALLAMPCILRAEEVEIQLVEVIQMTPLPGDDPLDGAEQSGTNPTEHPFCAGNRGECRYRRNRG